YGRTDWNIGADEDVQEHIAVAGHEVRRQRVECDPRAVGADARRNVGDAAITGLAERAGANQFGGFVHQVAAVHLGVAGWIHAVDEIAGERTEGDEPGVGADAGRNGGVVALLALVADARADGLAGRAVVHEDISDLVGVAGYEVGRVR